MTEAAVAAERKEITRSDRLRIVSCLNRWADLMKLVPADMTVALDTLDIGQDRIAVTGRARDTAAASAFRANVQASKVFQPDPHFVTRDLRQLGGHFHHGAALPMNAAATIKQHPWVFGLALAIVACSVADIGLALHLRTAAVERGQHRDRMRTLETLADEFRALKAQSGVAGQTLPPGVRLTPNAVNAIAKDRGCRHRHHERQPGPV